MRNGGSDCKASKRTYQVIIKAHFPTLFYNRPKKIMKSVLNYIFQCNSGKITKQMKFPESIFPDIFLPGQEVFRDKKVGK